MSEISENSDTAHVEESSTSPILSYSFAKSHGLIATRGEDGVVLATKGAMEIDPLLFVEVRRAAGSPFKIQELDGAAFDQQLSSIYAVDGIASGKLADDLGQSENLDSLVDDIPQTADLLDSDDDAPVIRLINGLIAEAVKNRGSDIHIEPYETGLSVRLRIDGVLKETLSLPVKLAPLLVSRIKVMARLDIAEKRIPQDGRISLTIGGKAIDVRVSTLPSRHGERVVLRLLDRDQAHFDISDLGMEEKTRGRFEDVIKEPNGIILVTGPTGSGKTTTLYAGLSLLNDKTRNILTVEDPVEYALEGVGQTQVNAKVGMTFAAGLRAMLRQDPDVVMVGEIRDVETAEIAVQASLTGHLVLSTVHTNSAVSAVTRLRDMGVEPFLLASTVKAILAQRLVRRLCPHCKTPIEADGSTKKLLNLPADQSATIFKANGCPECNGTGYQGRVGLYELVIVDSKLQELIHDDAREQAIADHAFKSSDTLAENGFSQVLKGTTTVEEVLRVCKAEREDHAGI
ncbi:type II secretion system ATPase GspE [Kordiimonas sp. SCSIO 12610]|uniref:type II secretion system ATPase GspE n=1 Tax=Kordiimonas sp. SCSIO 12610 TaxID=2829597 RepID=UPI002108CD1C|nr:type II secretion system ATPase GspE [Kordiimonas sp. SCSIO 12610]